MSEKYSKSWTWYYNYTNWQRIANDKKGNFEIHQPMVGKSSQSAVSIRGTIGICQMSLSLQVFAYIQLGVNKNFITGTITTQRDFSTTRDQCNPTLTQLTRAKVAEIILSCSSQWQVPATGVHSGANLQQWHPKMLCWLTAPLQHRSLQQTT